MLKHANDPVEIVTQYRPMEYHNFESKIIDIKEKMANSTKSGSLTTTQMKTLFVRYVTVIGQRLLALVYTCIDLGVRRCQMCGHFGFRFLLSSDPASYDFRFHHLFIDIYLYGKR